MQITADVREISESVQRDVIFILNVNLAFILPRF